MIYSCFHHRLVVSLFRDRAVFVFVLDDDVWCPIGGVRYGVYPVIIKTSLRAIRRCYMTPKRLHTVTDVTFFSGILGPSSPVDHDEQGVHCSKYLTEEMCFSSHTQIFHDDVIKWKHFPHYWPFVRGIHRSPVNARKKDQWRGALMFSLICVWINGWVNNREAGNLRRYCAHYDVSVMLLKFWGKQWSGRMLYTTASIHSQKLQNWPHAHIVEKSTNVPLNISILLISEDFFNMRSTFNQLWPSDVI